MKKMLGLSAESLMPEPCGTFVDELTPQETVLVGFADATSCPRLGEHREGGIL
jgi:hypothetical protein